MRRPVTMGRLLLLASLILGAGSCKLDDLVTTNGGGEEGPNAGTLLVVLNSPHADDGAVRLTLTGPQITTPRAASSNYLVFSRQRSRTEVDIVVFGDLQSEPIVAMPMLDVATVDSYSAVVTEAATRSDTLRADLSGYSTIMQAVPD